MTRQFIALSAIELLLLVSPGLAISSHHCDDAEGSHSNTHCVFCFQLASATISLPTDAVGLPAIQYHDWVTTPLRQLNPSCGEHHQPSLPRAPPTLQ